MENYNFAGLKILGAAWMEAIMTGDAERVKRLNISMNAEMLSAGNDRDIVCAIMMKAAYKKAQEMTA